MIYLRFEGFAFDAEAEAEAGHVHVGVLDSAFVV
jgi:hypothetical protein